MAQPQEKQVIFDIYEFDNGYMVETSYIDSQNSHESKKKIVKTFQEVEEYLKKEFIDFSLDG